MSTPNLQVARAAGAPAVSDGLSAQLRRGGELLARIGPEHPAALRARDRLERDLLPRTVEGAPYVVVGIVGPNNAGKSALFNALVGTSLSPSVPTGGATRRLVGAAHPDLLARLASEPTLARFRLHVLPDREQIATAALRATTDPTELFAAAEPRLPTGVMLIDTPDFDSILEDNRLASESLLAVADLVVVIVTRHTYQNRDVVRFLESWLDYGRPWMLVYNEAIDEQVARAHVTKLALDVGTPPVAAFWAAHNVGIQQGTETLEPLRLHLDSEASGGLHGEQPALADGRLKEVLFHLESIAEIKARAFSASLRYLRHDVDAVIAGLGNEARAASDVLAVAEVRAQRAGIEVASSAMPGGPFIEAFRQVLDRRSNPFSRSWRSLLRQIRVGIESLPGIFRSSSPAAADSGAPALAEIERQHLRQAWPTFWEEIVRDLGREGRHRARAACGETVTTWLDADLRPERRADALARAEQQLGATGADFEGFRRTCEELIEAAVEERGFDFDIQAAADLATLAPIAVAAAVIVKTGGFGADLAIAGGGAVSTFLMEKYTHLLGSSLTAAARERWTDLRARQLAQLLVDAALEHAAPRLREQTTRNQALVTELREWGASLR